jgi:CRP/FNR family transcriptional regulator, cyclic AMP receptor protein
MHEARVGTIPLFASLSKRQRRRIAQCADEVDVREGKCLVDEGAFAYEFFAIEEGTAEVRRGDERVAELGPGDFFGEIGVMDRVERNATVVATSSMTLVVMTRRDLREVAREMPKVADRIRVTIEERLSPLDTSA